MLHVRQQQQSRSQSQLGQAYQSYPGSYGYAQPGYVDPLVDAGLTAAGTVLAQSDPGAPQTMQLIRRIIVAPGLSVGVPTPGAPDSVHKLSDLNPTLEKIAFFRENEMAVILGLLAVPVVAFFLGRSTRR